MQQIIKSCIDLSDIQKPKVNLQLYQQMIMQAVVKKAPFNPKNNTEFAKLSTNAALGILNKLMESLPLEKLVAPMVTAATGQNSMESLNISTPTVQ